MGCIVVVDCSLLHYLFLAVVLWFVFGVLDFLKLVWNAMKEEMK